VGAEKSNEPTVTDGYPGDTPFTLIPSQSTTYTSPVLVVIVTAAFFKPDVVYAYACVASVSAGVKVSLVRDVQINGLLAAGVTTALS
jgi:hypothetical protein